MLLPSCLSLSLATHNRQGTERGSEKKNWKTERKTMSGLNDSSTSWTQGGDGDCTETTATTANFGDSVISFGDSWVSNNTNNNNNSNNNSNNLRVRVIQDNTVKFSPNVIVHVLPKKRRTLTEKECLKLWYTQEELYDIQVASCETVLEYNQLMTRKLAKKNKNNGDKKKKKLKQTKKLLSNDENDSGEGDNVDDDASSNNSEENNKKKELKEMEMVLYRDYRGLENMIHVNTKQKEAVQCILSEQKQQRQRRTRQRTSTSPCSGSNDETAAATTGTGTGGEGLVVVPSTHMEHYKKIVDESMERALYVALMDESIVSGIYRNEDQGEQEHCPHVDDTTNTKSKKKTTKTKKKDNNNKKMKKGENSGGGHDHCTTRRRSSLELLNSLSRSLSKTSSSSKSTSKQGRRRGSSSTTIAKTTYTPKILGDEPLTPNPRPPESESSTTTTTKKRRYKLSSLFSWSRS